MTSIYAPNALPSSAVLRSGTAQISSVPATGGRLMQQRSTQRAVLPSSGLGVFGARERPKPQHSKAALATFALLAMAGVVLAGLFAGHFLFEDQIDSGNPDEETFEGRLPELIPLDDALDEAGKSELAKREPAKAPGAAAALSAAEDSPSLQASALGLHQGEQSGAADCGRHASNAALFGRRVGSEGEQIASYRQAQNNSGQSFITPDELVTWHNAQVKQLRALHPTMPHLYDLSYRTMRIDATQDFGVTELAHMDSAPATVDQLKTRLLAADERYCALPDHVDHLIVVTQKVSRDDLAREGMSHFVALVRSPENGCWYEIDSFEKRPILLTTEHTEAGVDAAAAALHEHICLRHGHDNLAGHSVAVLHPFVPVR